MSAQQLRLTAWETNSICLTVARIFPQNPVHSLPCLPLHSPPSSISSTSTLEPSLTSDCLSHSSDAAVRESQCFAQNRSRVPRLLAPGPPSSTCIFAVSKAPACHCPGTFTTLVPHGDHSESFQTQAGLGDGSGWVPDSNKASMSIK